MNQTDNELINEIRRRLNMVVAITSFSDDEIADEFNRRELPDSDFAISDCGDWEIRHEYESRKLDEYEREDHIDDAIVLAHTIYHDINMGRKVDENFIKLIEGITGKIICKKLSS
jgi:hypothetical protein